MAVDTPRSHRAITPTSNRIVGPEIRLHRRVAFLLESAELLANEALAAHRARSVHAVVEALTSLRTLLAKELPALFNLVLTLQSQLAGSPAPTVEFQHFVAMLGIREWSTFGQAGAGAIVTAQSVGDPVLSAGSRLELLARMTAQWNATFRGAPPSVEVSSRAVRVLGPMSMHLRIIEQML